MLLWGDLDFTPEIIKLNIFAWKLDPAPAGGENAGLDRGEVCNGPLIKT
jgi:hypothetical protein